MTSRALRIEGVSKLYRLGEVGTGTLSHDLNRMWARLRGKEDPYKRVGEVNARASAGGSDYVWALKDVSFEVAQGEILGIIGRNGAGKSTLLKLLSRVTAPTEGKIYINGRIASLLEVGTGFHPELTGRENIYLNGAILGMTRKEIGARFDEIVEFSGCAKYVDTPVKRYSSGMYVRLAFAVAAHLETDILIVDEVLAVGDAEFQQKCLGKMQSLSHTSHRTVLFVSHNMAALKQLCPRSVLLERGTVAAMGDTQRMVERYMASGCDADRYLSWPPGEEPGSNELRLISVSVTDRRGRTDSVLATSNEINITVRYRVEQPLADFRVGLCIYDSGGALIFITSDYRAGRTARKGNGEYESTVTIPPQFLLNNRYVAEVRIELPRDRDLIEPQRCGFHIAEMDHDNWGPRLAPKLPGFVHPELTWCVEKCHALIYQG